MIVPMKKLTLMCVEAERERTLDTLRELGVLHLTPVKRPDCGELDEARAHLRHLRTALEFLPKHTHHAKPSGMPPHKAVESIWKLTQERKTLRDEKETLEHEQARLAPFGAFDPADLTALAEQGLTVKLYQAGIKQELHPPEDATLVELGRDQHHVFFVVIRKGDLAMDAQEVRLPDRPTKAITDRLAAIEAEHTKLEEALAAHTADRAAISRIVDEAEDRVNLLEAREGMGGAERVTYLQGFLPSDTVESVRKEAAGHGWGLIVEEPTEDDKVPTLIRNPQWVKPIKAVFDFIGVVPGYHEVDISAVFLLFFSLFFAMLVGDAGYGALFVIGTLWMKKKKPALPGYVVALLMITGVATIVWGVLTGTYFGIANLPAPLAGLKVEWLTNPTSGQGNVMGLCFLIGAIQLSIAHVWNTWKNRHSLQALAQIGWLCTTWTMYFAAGNMVLSRPFPKAALVLLGVGVALIVLFMTPLKKLKAEAINHVMLPLNLISNFVDVVSYIRLFAVGTATLAVAGAFNNMAAGLGFDAWWKGLVAAIILLLGHSLNIALAAMGVIVHGVRLNTLEFSGHLGMQWTGSPYRPFARKKDEALNPGT